MSFRLSRQTNTWETICNFHWTWFNWKFGLPTFGLSRTHLYCICYTLKSVSTGTNISAFTTQKYVEKTQTWKIDSLLHNRQNQSAASPWWMKEHRTFWREQWKRNRFMKRHVLEGEKFCQVNGTNDLWVCRANRRRFSRLVRTHLSF